MRKLKLLIISLMIGLGTLIYFLFYIDNNLLHIKEINLYSKKINLVKHGLKIVQFSDTHYNNENVFKVKQLYQKIKLVKPDIIIFTGDLTNQNLSNQNQQLLTNYLHKLPASTIKLAILGENDNHSNRQILNNSEFTVLANQGLSVYFKDDIPIYFYGAENNPTATSLTLNKNDIKKENILIFLTHNPDNISQFLPYQPDFVFAGHNHNGEINIPFIDLNPNRKYPAFNYNFKTTKLYISHGLGQSKHQFRFNSQPRIELYRLLTKKS